MISAVVLTKNNEQTILATLESLIWCNEIIVIDDQSDDKTVELAESLHTQIFKRKLDGDFAGQRNFGLTKAKGDWILFVDSDEIVTDLLREEINNVIRYSTYEGFSIKRDDYFFGKKLKYGETGNVRLIRLAKKEAGVWSRPVHEIWEVHGKTGDLLNPILHNSHADVSQFLQDINIYSSMNARYLFERNIREPAWYIVGYPLAKFIRNYIFLKGFLDGMPGAILAIMMSLHSFLTRAKLFILWHKTDPRLRT